MKNVTNRPTPALPNGLVVVDKGSALRQVQVGILTSGRMPSFGFDVSGSAPNHYRVVEYGKFGVVIGARAPVEVRVLLDNELLVETQLLPYDMPSGNIDPRIRQAMSESPQPHFLMTGKDGKPFQFTTHENPENLSEKDLLAKLAAEQIHPGRSSMAPTMDNIDRAGEPIEDVKLDIDPIALGLMAPQTPPALPDGAPQPELTEVDASLAKSDNSEPTVSEGASGELPEDLRQILDQHKAKSTVAEETIAPMDPTTLNRSWAPSHGLVAVGVRMMQTVAEGEMHPGAPDSYTYVLFQLNPWKLHSVVQSRLMGRILMPSKADMRKMMEAEGFGSELSDAPDFDCCMSANHKHR